LNDNDLTVNKTTILATHESALVLTVVL